MVFFTTGLRQVITVSAVTLAVSFGSVGIAMAETLNGAGATFPKPLYDRYFDSFKKDAGIQVNYEAIGSGGGIKQMIAGTVDFAGSDAAMKDEDIAKVKRGVLMIPTAGGAVAVTYNLPGVPSGLKISRAILPAIFAGEITKWNDSKIVKDNPGIKLPNTPIRLVVRADSSGTSFAFSSHLSAVSSGFKSKVGASTTPKWPSGVLTAKGNAGVAATVQQTVNSLGYVEASYAEQNRMPVAQLQNKRGVFARPTIAEANKAFEGVTFPANFRVFEDDPDNGYPVVTMTWLLVYKQYEPSKAVAVKKLIEWVLTKGQSINGSLEYTRVPQSVAQRAIQTVKSSVVAKK